MSAAEVQAIMAGWDVREAVCIRGMFEDDSGRVEARSGDSEPLTAGRYVDRKQSPLVRADDREQV
jgi:hypothetical protein